jgi:hypothetical protein
MVKYFTMPRRTAAILFPSRLDWDLCPLDPKKGTQTMDSDLEKYGQDLDHNIELGQIYALLRSLYVYMYIYVRSLYVYMYICVCVCIYIYMCVCVCVHAYIHVHLDTYIHIYT